MPFEITPVVVGSGLPAPGTPAEPVNTTTFGPTPAPAPSGIPGTPPSFLQWKYEGEPLGGNDVLIVDFVYPLIATRGVGEHENVITVRRFVAPPPPPPVGDYYTTLIYPFLTSDFMSIGVPTLERGYTMDTTVDGMSVGLSTLESGTLEVTIAFTEYAYSEEVSVGIPTLESGTLEVTIAYIVYVYSDEMSIGIPTLESGTLEVTIEYVVYAFADEMSVGIPTLTAGTLV
jgi:hypothetical protein